MNNVTPSFLRALKEVLHIEGEYSNHPSDTGGKTKYGITERTARRHGYKGPMDKLPLELAHKIYLVDYWNKSKADKIAVISEDLALEVFEQAVNFGVRTPQFLLQRTLNNMSKRYKLLKRDGVVGRKTLSRLKALQKSELQKRVAVINMNGLQCEKYNTLCENRHTNKDFFLGWVDKRVRVYRAI